MFVKSDAKLEEKSINALIKTDVELKKQHELFEAEMKFKQELINARKANSLTQKDMSQITGLSQQAISRMERGVSGTIGTTIRYLDSLGYSLTIKKNK